MTSKLKAMNMVLRERPANRGMAELVDAGRHPCRY